MKKAVVILSVFVFLFGSCKSKEEGPVFLESTGEGKAPFKFKGCIEPDTFIKLVKKVGPSVVNINTSKTVKLKGFGPYGFFGGERDDFWGGDLFEKFFGSPDQDRTLKQQSLGSGFIISKEGYIITNNHVVEKADEINVTLSNESSNFKAKVIGKDKKTDVALIKIDAKTDLKPVFLGDSDALEVGEVVVAIGNPFGLSHTVTQGIVSAKGRSIGMGNYESFIQTDASINPGNSGGPLLNIDGEVVGINSAIMASGQGIGFSIPINLAKNVVTQLRDKGKVTRAWIGVYVQKVTDDLAKSLKLEKKEGALIASVADDGPASKAGLKAGDVIVSFDGKRIKDFNELPLLVSTQPVGKQCELVIVRDGKEKKITVTLDELKESQEVEIAKSEQNELGLVVQNVSKERAKQLGMKNRTIGVEITSVDESGPAGGKNLKEGDVIIELNKKEVKNVKNFNRICSKLKKGDDVLIYLKRDMETTLFVAFTL